MERFGFIHEKLDIKILILFILSRLPGEVPPEVLGELCQCDDGIGYFDDRWMSVHTMAKSGGFYFYEVPRLEIKKV